MKTYMDFSSLTEELGLSGKMLYSVSNHTHRHYRATAIPKGNGETRKLYVPDDMLMAIQRRIHQQLLSQEQISVYATAYRPGGSTLSNAQPHVGKSVLLKLDIRHFFDNLIYPIVKEKAFPASKYSEANRILLALLCIHKDALPQGAPTSPAISNIIMREFDDAVGTWCTERDIAYTRYCDDMTFSGDFDPRPVIRLVKEQLRKLGLFLNDKKTVVVRKGQRHSVTGIVVNETVHIPASYKKHIRQQMYYCTKYGFQSHLNRIQRSETAEEFVAKLIGQINYVLSVEPDNEEMQGYRNVLKKTR